MKRTVALLLASLASPLLVGCSSSSTDAKSTPDAGVKDTGGHADVTKTEDTGTKPASDAGVDAPTDAPPIPTAWNAVYARPTDDTAASARASCSFARGAMPAQTTGSSTAIDTDIPIDHIVVLMQENRSFDSYLGHLAAYEATLGINNTIESPPEAAMNPPYPVDQVDGGAPNEAGTTYPYTHAPQLCAFDTAHSWGAAHLEYDEGLDDGFYYANNGNGDTGESTMGIAPAQLTGARALWYYDETDLPFYYQLYSTFAMGDHYFSALLGSTYPNRMYLYAATSFGLTANTFPDISAYPTVETPVVIFDELFVRGVSFKWYTDGVAAENIIFGSEILGPGSPSERYGGSPTASFADFLSAAQAGTLPAVSFVDGDNSNETTTGNDEHPPSQIEIGQQFVWQVVNAITTSPLWSRTVLFITYDENGGIYDHVPPPSACEPDSIAPVLTTPLDQSQPGAFNRYGFRVPFVAISPYAKKSYVSHTVYSHTSITRFIESKFKIPALTARDANADPLSDLFDWQNPPFMTPPSFTQPTINQAAVTQCTSELTPPN